MPHSLLGDSRQMYHLEMVFNNETEEHLEGLETISENHVIFMRNFSPILSIYLRQKNVYFVQYDLLWAISFFGLKVLSVLEFE